MLFFTYSSKKTEETIMAKKRFSFLDEAYGRVLKNIEVTKQGEARVKRAEFRKAVESAFEAAAKASASGDRVRFPVIGALVRKDVKARKAGQGVNPFTGEPMTIKARPAFKKPRWSFPRNLKDLFAKRA